jgi:hypothetical protein
VLGLFALWKSAFKGSPIETEYKKLSPTPDEFPNFVKRVPVREPLRIGQAIGFGKRTQGGLGSVMPAEPRTRYTSATIS